MLVLELSECSFVLLLRELDRLSVLITDRVPSVFPIHDALVLQEEHLELILVNLNHLLFFLVAILVLIFAVLVLVVLIILVLFLVLHGHAVVLAHHIHLMLLLLLVHLFIFVNIVHIDLLMNEVTLGVLLLLVLLTIHVFILILIVVALDLTLIDVNFTFVFALALLLVLGVVLLILLVDHLLLNMAILVLRVAVKLLIIFYVFLLHSYLALGDHFVLGSRRVLGEVGGRVVQTIVVVGRNQQVSLLVGQVLVWVHASLSEDSDVPLQLFDLVQVVNEGFGYLLHEQGPVRHIKLDLCLDLVVRALEIVHLASGSLLSLLALLRKALPIGNQSGRAFNSLLETVLLDVALHLFLKVFVLLSPLLLHKLSAHFDSRVVLGSRSWLFNLLVTVGPAGSCRGGPLLGEGGVDHLVLLVHVGAQLGRGSCLVKLEGDRLSGVLRLLQLLHLRNESFLDSAEVGHRPGSRRLEAESEVVRLLSGLSRLKVLFLLPL